MDNLKTLAIAVIVSVVTVVGITLMAPISSQVEQKTGALAGPDIASPYLQWGGLYTYQYSQSMAIASTTCSFVSPAATSTLQYAAARVSNSSTGGTLQYEWGISTSPNATTTSLGIGTITTAGQGVVVASTTNAQTGDIVDQQNVLAPSTYVNLKIGSSTPTTQAGTCYAKFIALP